MMLSGTKIFDPLKNSTITTNNNSDLFEVTLKEGCLRYNYFNRNQYILKGFKMQYLLQYTFLSEDQVSPITDTESPTIWIVFAANIKMFYLTIAVQFSNANGYFLNKTFNSLLCFSYLPRPRLSATPVDFYTHSNAQMLDTFLENC